MRDYHFRIYEVVTDGKTVGYKIDRTDTYYKYPDINVYSDAFTDGPIPFIPYATNWLAEKYLEFNDKEYNILENILVYEEIIYKQNE